jgi:hypothetical protein
MPKQRAAAMVKNGDPPPTLRGGLCVGSHCQQNHKCDFSVGVHRPNSRQERHFLVGSRSYPHASTVPHELCSRAQVPCTPVVADSGRAALHRAALSFQRMDLHLTEFQRSTRSCGQRKGPGVIQPGPNNRTAPNEESLRGLSVLVLAVRV